MSFNKVTKSASISLLASFFLPLTGAMAAQSTTATVPAKYAQTYNALNKAVGTFQTSLDKRAQSASSTPFASKFLSADASSGPDLLQPQVLKNAAADAACYKQMGIQGVVIHAGFPILCPQFLNAPGNEGKLGTCQQYMDFYRQVFQTCHAAGLQVMVESHPDFPYGGNQFSQQVQKYCQSLSSTEYQNQVAQHNANLASLGPDYISIVSEPNTDLLWSGQSLYRTPSALATFVATSAKAIKSANPKVATAAGAPNWQTNAPQFDTLFAQIPGLDAIDIHIYFSGNNELEFATTLADSAKQMGKQVVVSECWLTKAGTGTSTGSAPIEPLPNNTQANTAMATATYSFWQPLDMMMIYSFFKWCNVENPKLFAFFYTQQLFANLDYSKYSSQSDISINNTEQALAHQNLSGGTLTAVGAYYSNLLKAARQNHY